MLVAGLAMCGSQIQLCLCEEKVPKCQEPKEEVLEPKRKFWVELFCHHKDQTCKLVFVVCSSFGKCQSDFLYSTEDRGDGSVRCLPGELVI